MSVMDRERELLEAVIERHSGTMPTPALVAVAAAASELLDPQTLPSLGSVDSEATRDPLRAVSAARARLTAAIRGVPSVAASAACARAARELGIAERALQDGAL